MQDSGAQTLPAELLMGKQRAGDLSFIYTQLVELDFSEVSPFRGKGGFSHGAFWAPLTEKMLSKCCEDLMRDGARRFREDGALLINIYRYKLWFVLPQRI